MSSAAISQADMEEEQLYMQRDAKGQFMAKEKVSKETPTPSQQKVETLNDYLSKTSAAPSKGSKPSLGRRLTLSIMLLLLVLVLLAGGLAILHRSFPIPLPT